jgi:predicted dehydrogenase
LKIERVYDDYKEALADPDVSVVHICTPNQFHYPIARDALAAGKHVICEKPMAMSTAEADDLVRLAAASGRIAAITFNQRYYPLLQEMRARVQRGDVGEIYIVQGGYLQDWLLEDTDWNWRLEPEAGGELRVVGDVGSHWLDLATFVTGRSVRSVFADMATFLPVRKKPLQPPETFAGKSTNPADYEERTMTTEDYASALLRFEGGTRAVMTLSQLSAGRKNRLSLEVSGSRSALAWNVEEPNELWIGHRDEPNELLLKSPPLLSDDARRFADYPGGHAEGYPDTFKQLFRAVYAAIDGDSTAQYPTFQDGAEIQHVCDAIAVSAREGRWVEVGRGT